MNKLYLFLVLLVVVGGGYYLMAQKKPTETMMPLQETTGVVEKQVIKEFRTDAKEFEFTVTEIRVKKGDMVTLTMANVGKMPHDWVVDEFTGAKTKQIKNGETDTITFVADKAGTYEFYCSVGQHRKNGMVGKLIVE